MEIWNTLSAAECELISDGWSRTIESGGLPFEGFNLRRIKKTMYSPIRAELCSAYESIPSGLSSYQFDVEFGLKVYTCLIKHGMTAADASNDGVWRYLQMKVLPDLIYRIWVHKTGDIHINESRMWKKSPRLYLKVLWWFIHIVWDTDEVRTRSHLNNSCDISQITDRTTMGYRINVYKAILHVYGDLEEKQISKRLLSRVLMLNSSYCSFLEPELLGIDLNEYVRSLYRELGVDV